MKTRPYAIAFVLTLCLAALGLPAQEAILSVLDSEQAAALEAGEFFLVSNAKKGPLVYEKIDAGEIKRAALPGGPSGMGRVECLWSVDSTLGPEAIFFRMHQISRLKGMQYFSRTRKRMKLLVEDASMVDPEDIAKDVPDPLPETLKDWNLFMFRQQDTKFGKNSYAFRSSREGDSLFMAITNLTDLKVGPLTALKKGKLTNFFAVLPREGGYLLYAGSFFDAAKGLSPTKDMEESLMNRLKALGTWLFEPGA